MCGTTSKKKPCPLLDTFIHNDGLTFGDCAGRRFGYGFGIPCTSKLRELAYEACTCNRRRGEADLLHANAAARK